MIVLVTKEAGLRKNSNPMTKGLNPDQSGIRDCKYCGSNHQCKQCPAHGKTCKSCGKKKSFC